MLVLFLYSNISTQGEAIGRSKVDKIPAKGEKQQTTSMTLLLLFRSECIESRKDAKNLVVVPRAYEFIRILPVVLDRLECPNF